MTFTYDLTTDVGKLRMEIGDTSAEAQQGVMPGGANLTDEELQYLLDREGSVGRATAAACEALSRAWSRVANVQSGPFREELGSVARHWADRGQELRRQYGGGAATTVTSTFKRVDGFSEAAESALPL